MMVTLGMDEKLTVKDLKSDVKPIWCPGCGDFGVLSSVMKVIIDMQLDPASVAIVSGIGCSGRFPAFLNAYGFHGVHGRALPIATGLKASRPDLTVFVVGGDGDAFSIGGGHLAHAARRNIDITYVVMDNEIYGLTKGQPSATSPADILQLSTSGESKGNRKGMIGLLDTHQTEDALNPLAMLLAYNASYVARAFSGRPRARASPFTIPTAIIGRRWPTCRRITIPVTRWRLWLWLSTPARFIRASFIRSGARPLANGWM
jgi:2-oxoglutarate ferredoxin oxidoreductase subunit beta